MPTVCDRLQVGCALHSGSISPLMILTTCNASSKSETAVLGSTPIRSLLGWSNSINNLSGVHSARRRRNVPCTSRHASRRSRCHDRAFRIAVGLEDKGSKGHPYPSRLRIRLGNNRRRPKWIRNSRETARFSCRVPTSRLRCGPATQSDYADLHRLHRDESWRPPGGGSSPHNSAEL